MDDMNIWKDDLTTPEVRTKCLYLLDELEKWDVRPYRRERIRIRKTIKFTYNMRHLYKIHDRLEGLLDKALMDKLSENL